MSATILPFIPPQSDAVMAITSHIPPSAMTAGFLGTRREGHALQISSDGLMLTVGYTVLEAEEIYLSNHRGETAEGLVLANDFDSGIALVKSLVSLGSTFLETAALSTLNPGDRAGILTHASRTPQPVTVFAKEEFAGRWEYLLDEAIYTIPLCENWSGAGLLNSEGKLCGVGSLAIGLQARAGKLIPGNLFIPTELVTPHLERMALYGETQEVKRPWLGVLVEEQQTGLYVSGVYHDAPAALAGIKPGDIILCVQEETVSTLAGFFRSIWSVGPAGTEIPVTIHNGSAEKDLLLKTTDRNSFFVQHQSQTIN